MKVTTPGHVYQAELLGWVCSREAMHIKETPFHRDSMNLLAKAGRIITNKQVTTGKDRIVSLVLTG